MRVITSADLDSHRKSTSAPFSTKNYTPLSDSPSPLSTTNVALWIRLVFKCKQAPISDESLLTVKVTITAGIKAQFFPGYFLREGYWNECSQIDARWRWRSGEHMLTLYWALLKITSRPPQTPVHHWGRRCFMRDNDVTIECCYVLRQRRILNKALAQQRAHSNNKPPVERL